jgi:hypothetical protein
MIIFVCMQKGIDSSIIHEKREVIIRLPAPLHMELGEKVSLG